LSAPNSIGDFFAIILGASSWPKAPQLTASRLFSNSANAFKQYLVHPSGLSVRPDQILDLFDDNRSFSDIDEEVEHFLRIAAARSGSEIKNLVLYYTGHGVFSEGDQKYCLAVKSTRIGALGASAYRVSSLARTLNRVVPDARKFIILDACFAGAAQPDFIPQGPVAERMEEQTMAGFAESGTALLCAASAADVALAPVFGTYTMFSDALLNVMQSGSPNRGAYLSFDDIRTLAIQFIRQKHQDDAVLPEVHVPDQRRGDLATVKFLPNPATSGEHRKNRSWRATYQNYLGNLTQIALKNPLRSSLGAGVASALACFFIANHPLLPFDAGPGIIFGAVLALWLCLFGARKKLLLMVAIVLVTLGWHVAVNSTSAILEAIPTTQALGPPIAQTDSQQPQPEGDTPDNREAVVQHFRFAWFIAGLGGGFIGAVSVALSASLNRRKFRRVESWSLTLLTGTFFGAAGMQLFPLFDLKMTAGNLPLLPLFLLWQPSVLLVVCYSLQRHD
jgi:hypothetical protein